VFLLVRGGDATKLDNGSKTKSSAVIPSQTKSTDIGDLATNPNFTGDIEPQPDSKTVATGTNIKDKNTDMIATPTNIIISGIIDAAKATSDFSKELDDVGLVMHKDGKARVDSFQGKGRTDVTPQDVTKAKSAQMRLSNAGKILGPASFAFSGYIMFTDLIEYQNDDISGARLFNRLSGVIIPISIGVVSAPAGIAAAAGFYAGETSYDSFQAGKRHLNDYNQRMNMQRRHAMERGTYRPTTGTVFDGFIPRGIFN
jgi:hypothetical protein